MRKIPFLIVLLCVAYIKVWAEGQTGVQPYGTVDMADLTMKACNFEKNANAMVLFDKGDLYYDKSYDVVIEVHKRIKIFNEAGKSETSIRLPFYSGYNLELIDHVKAQTINLTDDGKIEITPVDSKQIFIEKTDKLRSAVVFAFPKVKTGSVVELQYRWKFHSFNILPYWDFQSNLPTRYSELQSVITDELRYKVQLHTVYPFTKETKSSIGSSDIHFWSINNVPSFQAEPYMGSRKDNVQSVVFEITGFKTYQPVFFFDTWEAVGNYLVAYKDFGEQMDVFLPGEKEILNKVRQIPTEDKKIAFLFNEVKNHMRWNSINTWYTNTGTRTAWDTKGGNSTEINLILYHLLTKAGMQSFPMLMSTREHGRINPAYPFLFQMNKTVIYIPIDSTQNYVLDASNKANLYNEVPLDLLNSFGLTINKEYKKFHTVFIQQNRPSREVIFINAQILDDKKEEGTVDISSYSYNKMQLVKKLTDEGNDKYQKELSFNNSGLSILDFKVSNIIVDSLPLKQNIKFKLNLSNSDDGYIYLTPAMFTQMKVNPFLSEHRTTDIDFGFLNDLSINGYYKIPNGYTFAALPKNVSLAMPDKSIVFNRMIEGNDGVLAVRYLIKFNKSMFFKENYNDLHQFYKVMFEMINEQIVLKKS